MNGITGIESTNLEREWKRLRDDPSLSAKPVFETSDTQFRIRVDHKTREWILDLEFPAGGPSPKIIRTLKFIDVEGPVDDPLQKRRLLTIKYDPNANDLLDHWPHFAEAICSAATKAHPKNKCTQSVAGIFNKWSKDRWPGKKKGLGKDLILGLFGELVFLKKLLEEKLPPAATIKAWHGPNARDHDFGVQKIALEVKSSGRKKNEVTISNLEQLNDADLNALYLVSIKLRPSNDTKHSLHALVDSIQQELNSEDLKIELNEKLILAGYFKAYEEQRKESGYRLDGLRIYSIKDGFPRILRKDLEDLRKFAPGVWVEKYFVRLDRCSGFVLSNSKEADLWKQLQSTD